MYCKLKTLKPMFTQKKGPYTVNNMDVLAICSTLKDLPRQSHLFLYVHTKLNPFFSSYRLRVEEGAMLPEKVIYTVRKYHEISM